MLIFDHSISWFFICIFVVGFVQSSTSPLSVALVLKTANSFGETLFSEPCGYSFSDSGIPFVAYLLLSGRQAENGSNF